MEPNNIHFLLVRPSGNNKQTSKTNMLQMTSFNGQRLEKRFKTKYGLQGHRREYLAMTPGPDHPLLRHGNTMYQTLTFDSNVSNARRGYLKVSEVFSMDWRDAQRRWNVGSTTPTTVTLSPASMRVVILAAAQLARYQMPDQFQPHSMQSPQDVLLSRHQITYHSLSANVADLPELAASPLGCRKAQGLWGRLWDYIKRTKLGIVVRSLCCIR